LPFQVRLTVAGPPKEEHAAIERMARALAPTARVDVVGPIGRARMPALFSNHDVLCVPSNFEALGVTLMEALASGIPVVSTNVGGVPEVLAGGRAGWLARPGEPNSIRTCLLQVVDDLGMRQVKMEYGRMHVKQFSHERMLESMMELAREMSRQHDHSVETA
jgi:glycosyltransferase involved in cell wall biosynthesis